MLLLRKCILNRLFDCYINFVYKVNIELQQLNSAYNKLLSVQLTCIPREIDSHPIEDIWFSERLVNEIIIYEDLIKQTETKWGGGLQ